MRASPRARATAREKRRARHASRARAPTLCAGRRDRAPSGTGRRYDASSRGAKGPFGARAWKGPYPAASHRARPADSVTVMRAVLFEDIGSIRVGDYPDPAIVDPGDVIVKVDTAAICGSDLHLLHGRTPGLRPDAPLRHEFVVT